MALSHFQPHHYYPRHELNLFDHPLVSRPRYNLVSGLLDDALREAQALERSMRREFGEMPEAGQVQIVNDRTKLAFNVDVRHFAPEEIQVKVSNGEVVIEAKHEERQDEHGFIQRHFLRRYMLPDSVDAGHLVSRLSSDGILTVEAPKKAVGAGGERAVPIHRTGQPALKEKPKQEEKKEAGSAKKQ